MNHQKIYDAIMEKSRNRGWTRENAGTYTEEHHVIPRSLGGTDDPENLTLLTAKEHFIAHLLLARIHKGTPEGVKMSRAFVMMTGIHKLMNVTARLYQVLREDHARELGPRMSKLHKGVPKTPEHRKKIGRSGEKNAMYGKTTSDRQKEAVRRASTGRVDKPETTEKRRQNGLGRIHSEETKAKISASKTGVPQSPEHAAKTRTLRLGKKNTEHQKQRVREANQATWEVVDPDGNRQVIVNLRQFCIDNGLDQGNMVAVSKGRLKAYKKWKCRKIEENQ